MGPSDPNDTSIDQFLESRLDIWVHQVLLGCLWVLLDLLDDLCHPRVLGYFLHLGIAHGDIHYLIDLLLCHLPALHLVDLNCRFLVPLDGLSIGLVYLQNFLVRLYAQVVLLPHPFYLCLSEESLQVGWLNGNHLLAVLIAGVYLPSLEQGKRAVVMKLYLQEPGFVGLVLIGEHPDAFGELVCGFYEFVGPDQVVTLVLTLHRLLRVEGLS